MEGGANRSDQVLGFGSSDVGGKHIFIGIGQHLCLCAFPGKLSGVCHVHGRSCMFRHASTASLKRVDIVCFG